MNTDKTPLEMSIEGKEPIYLTHDQIFWLSNLLLEFQELDTTEHHDKAMASTINSELLDFLPL